MKKPFFKTVNKGVDIFMAFQRPSAEPWKVNEEEVAYVTQPASVRSSSFKCFVPKLMPALTGGVALDKPEFFNTNFLCNSSECKPTLSSTVTTSNYVTVKNSKNLHWKKDTFGMNTQVKVQSVGNSTENLKMTSKIDNTTGEDFDMNMAIKIVAFVLTGEMPELPSHVDDIL